MPAHHQERQVVAGVRGAVRNARAIQNRHVIQERAVAVGRRAELRQVLREQLDVITVDPGHALHQLGNKVVVRQRMVRFGHANLRVWARALFFADHEGNDAREIGLERQELQVEHQRQVIFKDRRCALRLLHRRQLEVALLLGFLDAPLHVANRVGILIDLGLILRSEVPLEAHELLGHRIENALVLPQPRVARGAVRAAAVAKQPLEHRSRIPLHRQRLRRAAPGERVRVHAAQDAGACPRVGRSVHRELERWHLRLAGEMPREQLVHRYVRDDLDLVSSAARRARQKRSGGARMDVVPVRLEAGQDEHLIPVRRQRLQNG